MGDMVSESRLRPRVCTDDDRDELERERELRDVAGRGAVLNDVTDDETALCAEIMLCLWESNTGEGDRCRGINTAVAMARLG